MGYAEELERMRAINAQKKAAIEANNAQLESQLNANTAALEKSQAENEAAMLQAQQRQQQDFADLALQYKRDYDAALAEDAALRKQEERGSALMGITEAVANLTNLIGVGYNGASNQQYHSYSKDWMDRADAERKARRNRIDNIRDRQKAMQQQLAQLRSQNAMQYISMRGQDANQRYNAALHTATALAGERNKLAQQEADDANKLANISINQGNADRQFKEQKRARQAQEEETRRHNEESLTATMARYGFVSDKKGGWTKAGSGIGSEKTDFSYDATIDGQHVKLNMNKKTFDQAVNDGRAELKEDAAHMAGYDSWDDMKSEYDKMSAKKRTRKNISPELQQFISQLSNSTVADQNAIAFVNEHRSELNNFNKHLLRVSSSSVNNGMQSQVVTPSAVKDNVEEEVLDANSLDKILGL